MIALEKLLKRLNNFCSVLSDKDIYVTTTNVLPKSLRDIAPSLPLSDGNRIYLPELKKGYTDEQRFEAYKRMIVQKVLQINDGVSDVALKKPDFSNYAKPSAANTIFEVLENEKYLSKAKTEFSGLYKHPDRDNTLFFDNFLELAKHLPRSNAKKLRKAAYRYTTLASEGKINEQTINQYTKKIYSCLDLKDEKISNPKDNFESPLESMLSFFGENNTLSDSSHDKIADMLSYYSDTRNKLTCNSKTKLSSIPKSETDCGVMTNSETDRLVEESLDDMLKTTDIKNITSDSIKRDIEDKKYNDQIENLPKVDEHFNPKSNSYQERDLHFVTNVMSDNRNNFYADSRNKYSSVINIMKNRFERLVPQAREEFRGCYAGSDIDLEAAITFMTDLRSGVLPKENTYIDVKKNERDVYVGMLLDCSGSMLDDKITLAKDTLVVFSEVFKSLGDVYSIFSFSGDYPRVNMHKIKAVDEKHSAVVESRIGNICAERENRDGAAIRYMADYMMLTPHKTNILMVISDGTPCDKHYDIGIQDTRNALLEAKSKSIRPYCISVDTDNSAEYLETLYGSLAFTVCSDISKLPESAGKFYEKIAFR